MRPLAAAAIAALLLLAGCGGDEKDAGTRKAVTDELAKQEPGAKDTDGDGLIDKSDPDPNEAGDGPSDDPTIEDPAATEAPSPLGKTVPVESSDTSLQVAATRVLDPLPVGGDDSTMNPGNRFVGIQFKVQNVGDVAYDDSSGNSVALLTTDGSQAESSTVFGGECRLNDKDFLAKTQPGDNRQGCVVFEVPTGAKLDKIQFTPDSGFSDDTAEWKAP